MTAIPDGATLYVILLVATLALHTLCVGFVVVGTGYLAVTGALGRDRSPLVQLTRDWLPFALGVGITAGVAPLLFVQILYQPRFYTANLLLFLRWLAIVPALVIGFYALYLGKTRAVVDGARRRRGGLYALAVACFVFVAWSWIDNHALSLASPETWAATYASGRARDPIVAPRLVSWLGLAAVAWAAGTRLFAVELTRGDRVTRAVIAIGGALVAVAGGLRWLTMVGAKHPVLAVAPARPWFGAAAVALAVVAALEIGELLGRTASRVVTLGATAVGLLAWAAGREATRIAAVDPRLGRRLADVGGQWLFVLALVVGVAAIAWCIRIARAAPPAA